MIKNLNRNITRVEMVVPNLYLLIHNHVSQSIWGGFCERAQELATNPRGICVNSWALCWFF